MVTAAPPLHGFCRWQVLQQYISDCCSTSSISATAAVQTESSVKRQYSPKKGKSLVLIRCRLLSYIDPTMSPIIAPNMFPPLRNYCHQKFDTSSVSLRGCLVLRQDNHFLPDQLTHREYHAVPPLWDLQWHRVCQHHHL